MIEKGLNSHIKDSILLCVDFEEFADLQVKWQDIVVSSKINLDSVDIKVEWPLSVRKGETVYRITKPYEVSYPVRLGLIHSLSTGIIDRIVLEPDLRHIGYIVSSFNMEGMNVSITPLESSDIYIITELKEENYLNNNHYIFMFGTKFG